jgi:hypothetical protein
MAMKLMMKIANGAVCKKSSSFVFLFRSLKMINVESGVKMDG